MEQDHHPQLLLERFKKVKIIDNTVTKHIVLLVNVNSGEKAIAKIQPEERKNQAYQRNVLHQASYLQKMQGHIGIPFMYWSGEDNNQLVLICEYLGKQLSELLQDCGGKFSLHTTCMLGLQIFKIVQNYHQKGILHRNLKPKNLQFGRGKKVLKLYFNDLIDSKRYRSIKNYQHVPFKQNVDYTFKNPYGSNNFKKRMQLSRRDDIESIILILISFITGKAPDSQNNFKDVLYPQAFDEMLKEVRKVEFTETPNYYWFTSKLKSVLFHNHLQQSYAYDWIKTKKHIDSLKIKDQIISLKTQLDDAILKEVYEPFQSDIEIDEVTTKYLSKFEQEENQKRIEQIHMRRQQSSKKDSEVEETVQRKQKTKDCSVM